MNGSRCHPLRATPGTHLHAGLVLPPIQGDIGAEEWGERLPAAYSGVLLFGQFLQAGFVLIRAACSEPRDGLPMPGEARGGSCSQHIPVPCISW